LRRAGGTPASMHCLIVTGVIPASPIGCPEECSGMMMPEML